MPLIKSPEVLNKKLSGKPGTVQFADLPFAQEMLEFHTSDHASKVAVEGGPRENIAKPLMAGNARKYLKSLSWSKVRTVEAYCGDLMRILGYNPEHSVGLMRSPWRAFWPMFTEPLERLVNRQVKPHYKVGHNKLTKALNAHAQPLLPWVYGDSDEH